MRKDYQRFVELSNKGAKELGFADTGAMWRSKYDMPPDAFTRELDRLWDQVRPLYSKVHAFVRMKLHGKYGDAVPANGPIPAHLLGNIWAQDWTNIYPLVAPPKADPGYSLTDILKKRNMPALDMVRTGERFYTSLGFAPLPKTFWDRSLFVRPKDREVVCHASAWDIDYLDDLRIKMCVEQTAEDFMTIHHELGHNFYQRAYKDQPPIFRNSANDGFHEAIGDTIALSVTPEYLVRIGLLDKAPDASRLVEAGRLHAAAQPVLDLRERARGPAAERDAVDGSLQAVAGRARRAHRIEADGRHRNPRLLRAALGVARRAVEGQTGRLVGDATGGTAKAVPDVLYGSTYRPDCT